MVKATIKKCSNCDDYTQLLINGQVKLDGDYYHDKIDSLIDGFFRGLNYCGEEIEIKHQNFICENCLFENSYKEEEIANGD